MKKFLPILISIVPVLVFLGCKAEIQTTLNVSNIKQCSIPQKIQADLFVEIAACNDFEDSRKPSSSLVEVQQKMPFVFPGAEYVECFTRKMDTYAHFTIEAAVVKEAAIKGSSDKDFGKIAIVNNNEGFTFLHIPRSIYQKMEQLNDSSFVTMEYEVLINLVNDTKENFKFTVFDMYVNGNPVQIETFELRGGGKITLKPSNVSVDSALQNGSSYLIQMAKL